MLRKNIRLRKEYLYSKNKELKEREHQEKLVKIKRAIENDKKVPNELKKQKNALTHDLELADDKTIAARTHIDDEYEEAKYRDPKVLVTTSRNASQRLTQFQKEMKLIIPNAIRINRGGFVLKDLVKIAQANNFTDLVILHETRGEPDGMIVCHLPYGPTAYFGLSNVVLRHDLKDKVDPVSEAYPHLIFDNFNTRLGDRISDILKYIFPLPKVDSKRVITFQNDQDFISFRHHVYKKDDHKTVALKELGPRFEMKPYQIVLGTVEIIDA
jgi:U3 small nucleolar ribonucleoprotein protein IMP4